ncbi:MAG: tryptophan synthase subunit beta [Marinifilaceae bacterium]
MKKSVYSVDENGFYGEFGGTFVPDVLKENIETLQRNYREFIATPAFQDEFHTLLRDYVGRPSPLYYAKRLSEKYNTKVYLKREDLNHTGAHKINNTIGQILLAKHMGKTRIIAETGAGQHGVASATVCALMDMECHVYMGAMDVERQMPNVKKMQMLGATVIPVEEGGRTLSDAVDAALMAWCADADSFYLLGSAVGPHPYPDMVTQFQSVISEEIRKQLLEKEGRETPDHVIACVGGGSNAAGAFYHFLDESDVNLVIAEASGKGVDTGYTAATATLGKPGVLHGSHSLYIQDENGAAVEPYSISAGLDYPGIGPLHALLATSGRAEVVTITDDQALAAAYELTRLEGIIPAIESSHALATLQKRQFGADEIVVINLSGRGDKDMDTYLKHLG